MTTVPTIVIGMREEQRVDGTRFLVGRVHERIVLEPGSELHLRRVSNGKGTTPPYGLQVIAPTAVVTKKALQQAAADRLDSSAIRHDPRDDAPDKQAIAGRETGGGGSTDGSRVSAPAPAREGDR